MVFYIRYDQKKFIESLSPVPTVEPTEVEDTGRMTVEVELSSVEQDIIIDDAESTDEVHDTVNDIATDDAPNDTIIDDRFSSVETDPDFDDLIEEASESHEPKDTRTMAEIYSDPYKHVEFMRSRLVEKYGDTPEVNTFLALELKQFVADSMTGEEVLRRSELLAKFYPHPDNIKALEATRKMVEHSIDKIFYRELPGVSNEDLIIVNPR